MRRRTFLVLGGLLILMVGCSSGTAEVVTARAGVIDLRTWDFSSPPRAVLNGEWTFVPGDLEISPAQLTANPPGYRTVPDLWNDAEAGGSHGFGAGTYHLTVLLPDHPPLALRYNSAATAFRIEVQGNRLVQVGIPSVKAEGSLPAYRPGTVRLPEVGNRLDLTVRVSNHIYRVGGLWFPLELGSVPSVEGAALTDFALALGHAVALASIGLLLLVLFLLRPEDRSFLFSALLAIAMALRGLVTGDYILTRFWESVPFEVLVRLEYLSVFVCFPIAVALFLSLVPRSLSRPVALVCAWAALVFVALALVLPIELLTRTIFGFYIVALVTVGVLLQSLVVHAFRKRDRNARLLLMGAVVLALTVINDVLYSSFFLKTANLGTWGFLFFILVLVWIVFERFTLAFSEVENLLSQKDILILEIQHRVRNNLQLMTGLISLQSKRIPLPEAKAALASLRSRVLSMGLVHEKLYGRSNESTLDLSSYLTDLMRLLVPQDSVTEGAIEVVVDVPPQERSVDLCLHIGLIVTELVNNAWKYALLPQNGGRLSLSVASNEKTITVLVEDNGPGFPEAFQPDRRTGLGYQLIESLAGSHSGAWEILPGPGGRVRVSLEAFS